RCLNLTPMAGGASWQLHGPGGAVTVDLDCRLQANDVLASHVAAVAGFGIAATADFVAAQAIARGELVQVLPRWTFADAAIHAVHAAGLYVPARARAFIDHMAAVLAEYRAPD
ncbi:LysR substrate-binding domain-containing protein, partial [Ramlibacter sp.]|uniref:LysR substrate-binding domain-containing protein n=1 Tax=Ramlibacter sp. TaxID=1917967 RepID=UPI00183085C6